MPARADRSIRAGRLGCVNVRDEAATQRADDRGRGKGADSAERVHRLALLACSAAYLVLFVDRGWIPVDVGLHGQTAERVLAGELPHRDFRDMYTGALSFLHAGVFALLGVDAIRLRWLLFAAALSAVPLIRALARRAVGPGPATACAALAVVWSFPLYFESMPSWYNLVLALAACEALLRSRESGHHRWLFVAGLAIGASIAIKSIGAMTLASAFLFLVFTDQEDRRGRPPESGTLGSVFVVLGCLAFVVAWVGFVGQWPTARNLLQFGLPGAVVGLGPALAEARRPLGGGVARALGLVHRALPLLAGVALPIGALLLPYWRSGALPSILDVDVLFPADRVERAYFALPHPATWVCVVPIALLFLAPRTRFGERLRGRLPLLVGVLIAVSLLAGGSEPRVYQLVWGALRPLVPLVALFAVGLLLPERVPTDRREALFLLVVVSALGSLVQFPQSMGIYFGYCAPLVTLAYVHLVGAQPEAPGRLHALFAALLFGYGVLWVGPSRPLAHGIVGSPQGPLVASELEKATLRVPPADVETYGALVAAIRQLSRSDECIWAGPDAPEVYFLSSRCNPTPTLTEIFDPDYDTPRHAERILGTIDDEGLPVAVVNRATPFSGMSEGLVEGLERRFLRRIEVRQFVLYFDPVSGSTEAKTEADPESESGDGAA